MKILKIDFKNINSLKGEHSIDFRESPFDSSALFAITGPTGSGKSTLLDVITLALYFEIPRIGKISNTEIEQKGAVLTRGQKEAYATVLYECKHGLYASTWSISTARTGNLRDYEVEVSDALTGEIITTKKSEAKEKNEELIGLSYDHFVKSVMLAQGDFARFLQVSKKERSTLLEKITGWDIYRKIGSRAYEKSKEFRIEISELEKVKQTWESELLNEEEWENHKEKQTLLSKKREELKRKESELDKIIEVFQEIEKEKNTLQSITSSFQEVQSKIEFFDKNEGNAIDNHERIAPITEDLKEWKRIQEQRESEVEKLQKAEKTKKDNSEVKETIHRNIESLLGNKVSENDVDDELTTFERQVLKYVADIDKSRDQYRSLHNEISLLLRPIGITVQSNSIEVNDLLEKKKIEEKETVEDIKNRYSSNELENVNNEIKIIESTIEKFHQAKSDSKQIQFLNEEKKKIVESKSKVEKEKEVLPEKIKVASEQYESIQKDLQIAKLKAKNQLLIATLEEHRHHLEDGKPCPLCGALEHPYSDDLTVDDGNNLEQLVTALEKQTNEASKELSRLKEQLDNRNQLWQELKEELKQIENSIQTLEDSFANKYSLPSDSDWDKLIQSSKRKMNDFSLYVDSLEALKVMNEAIPKLEELHKIILKGKELAEQKNQLFASNEDVSEVTNDAKKKWSQIQSKEQQVQSRILDIQNEIKLIDQSFEQIDQKVGKAITDRNLPSKEWALGSLLPFEKYNELNNKRKKLQETKLEFSTKKEDLTHRINQLEKDQKEVKLPEIKEEKLSISSENQQTQKELEDINRVLLNHKENKEKAEKLQEKIDVVQKDSKYWLLLNELIGDSTGNKFNTFAQELTLLQLLDMANNRLESLSKRYLLANPYETEDDSLVIIDKDMGGQRRSVKTLSGGETFVISLALALALSDLASQNVQIESLFIDEGFGTLDPEILDQVLDSLETLQQEGSKMIGMISHVSSLKERISTQIQLEQNGRGYSTIEVVSL